MFRAILWEFGAQQLSHGDRHFSTDHPAIPDSTLLDRLMELVGHCELLHWPRFYTQITMHYNLESMHLVLYGPLSVAVQREDTLGRCFI